MMHSPGHRASLAVAACLIVAAIGATQAFGNIYYGHLHNHCNISDGTGGTPDQAYAAAQAGGLDFFGLSDHAYLMDAVEFATMQTAANNANQPGVFTAFWGFEWSSGTYGHVTVVNPASYTTVSNSDTNTFTGFMQWLDANADVAFLNHPVRGSLDFDCFTGAYSDTIVGMELWNKDVPFSTYYYNTGFTSDGRDRSGYFDEALFQGWTIGAAGSRDEHGSDWGSGGYRLAIIAESNTRASLMEAMTARSFYTTLDENLQLHFTVDGSSMGSSGLTGGLNTCVIQAGDPDDETFTKIEVIRSGYIVHAQSLGNVANPSITCNVVTEPGDYIYCKVTQTDGHEAISSPVFISYAGSDGPPRAGLMAPLDNGPDDLDSANDRVIVNRTQPDFQIKLTDLDGIDDGTVTSAAVSIAELTLGTDYAFSYDAVNDVITLASLQTDNVFGNGTYTITAAGIRDLQTPDPETMETKTFVVSIDTSIVVPKTLTFQQGADYAGTVDTMIHGAYPSSNYAASTIITPDTSDAGGVSQVLLRFDGIIGDAADQIPADASITSATLRLRSLDVGFGGQLHAMLQPWSDTSTWNDLGNGIQADDTEALSVADDGITGNSPADVDLDVTLTVQSWVDGAMANHGWAVLPGGTDGWDIASAEYPTADYRPELIVTFVEGQRPPVADAGGDRTVSDSDNSGDEPVELNGSGSYHPGEPEAWITSYVWTVDGTQLIDTDDYPNDGIITEILTIGEHTARLAVTDSDGVVVIDEVTITVNPNMTPTADAGGDQIVNDLYNDGSELVTLDGSLSGDLDGHIEAYEWTIDGQVIPDPDGDLIVSVTLDVGKYTATLSVTDNGGVTVTDSAEITVEALPLFSDDFESGGFAAGGWIASAQAMVETTSANGGTYGALLKKTSTIETALNTGGLTSATFTYWAATSGLKTNAEYLYVEWSQDGGSTWSELNALTGTNGYAQYSHDLTFAGTSFSIRFSTNGGGGNDLAMIDDIVIQGAGGGTGNTVPTAADDSATTNEDVEVTINVLGNDSDPDEGDTLSVSSLTQPGHGSATVNGGSTITYTPDANYNGSDSFTYTVSDGNGGTDTATVSLTIQAVNDSPVAANDSVTTQENTAITIMVLANDSDIDGDSLTVDSVASIVNGTVTNNGNSVTFTPDADFTGTGSFEYTVSDGLGGTDTAAVSVAVTAPVPNNDPTAVADSATTQADTPVTIMVLANDLDVDGDTLAVASVTQGAYGAVVNNGSSVTYTPNAGFTGTDSFTYTASDGKGGTATATVTVVVEAASGSVTVSVVTSTERAAPPNVLGVATVTVLDEQGSPISGATVTGNFTGDIGESVSGVTDGNGQVVLKTMYEYKKPTFDFVVNSVTVGGTVIYP